MEKMIDDFSSTIVIHEWKVQIKTMDEAHGHICFDYQIMDNLVTHKPKNKVYFMDATFDSAKF